MQKLSSSFSDRGFAGSFIKNDNNNLVFWFVAKNLSHTHTHTQLNSPRVSLVGDIRDGSLHCRENARSALHYQNTVQRMRLELQCTALQSLR